MEFETIKDQKGKDHIVFKGLDLSNDESIGDKFEDFEPLKKLGSGAFGEVLKVSSLINHKIYAMKILELKGDDNFTKAQKEDYYISEVNLLKKLDHPNIVKYYKSFRDDDKIYIIMEYFDNGDLEDYIDVLKYRKNQDKKEEIWNIFYQCMSGLHYIHSLAVIHRDIKPTNIFMTKNKVIKIGDFGASAIIGDKINMEKIHRLNYTQIGTEKYMAPELFKKILKYTSKIDIYSMGCVFYKICCLEDYQTEDYELIDGRYQTNIVVKKEIPTNYDADLMKIIKEMLNKDDNIRPDSGKVLEEVKFNYNKVFIQNSGFYSVLRCMANLPQIRNKYKKILNEDNKDDNSSKNSYSERFLYFVENEQNWIENITFFRNKMVEENNFLNNNKEISPSLIFSFIINKIHSELNRVENNEEEYKIQKKISDIELTKKPMKEEKVLREYINLHNANFNSIISKYFLGDMETIRICSKCNLETFLFTYYFFLDLDLNLPLLKKREKKEIDLIELFKIQNEISLNLEGLKKIMCVNCAKELEHKESKLFFILPNQLVISFDRGNEYENTIKINYPEILDLSSIPRGKKFSPKLFQLVGIIKRCDIGIKEHYISLILNSKNWYLYDNEKSEKIKSQSEHKDGKVVMLFYESAKMK